MMKQRRYWAVLLAVLALIDLSGCGESGPPAEPRASVRGSITWEGKPIEEGTISFVPVGDTKGSPAMATISGGQYTLNRTMGPAIGPNRVEIIGNRDTGKRIPAAPPATGEIPQYEQFVPEKYNTRSRLETEIKAGDNKVDYDLTEK
jgi:predicted small lipoprotein YifL